MFAQPARVAGCPPAASRSWTSTPTTSWSPCSAEREPTRRTVVVGLIRNHTDVVPEGMSRVTLLSDPTQGLGNLAEPECRRVNAALA